MNITNIFAFLHLLHYFYGLSEYGIFVMDIDQHQTNKGLEIGDRLLQISSDVNDNTLFILFLTFIFIRKIFMI